MIPLFIAVLKFCTTQRLFTNIKIKIQIQIEIKIMIPSNLKLILSLRLRWRSRFKIQIQIMILVQINSKYSPFNAQWLWGGSWVAVVLTRQWSYTSKGSFYIQISKWSRQLLCDSKLFEMLHGCTTLGCPWGSFVNRCLFSHICICAGVSGKNPSLATRHLELPT